MSIHLIGQYLDDIINELKNKFARLRQEPELSSLSEKEWIALQLNFITKTLGHRDLLCIERDKYLRKIIQQCVGTEDTQKLFTLNAITCFDENGKMNIFYICTPNDGSKRIIYRLNDSEGIVPITQDEINEMLSRGLRILSKTKREEYLRVLSDGSTLGQNDSVSSIRDMALLPEVMAKFGEASAVFEEFTRYNESKESKGRDWVHD